MFSRERMMTIRQDSVKLIPAESIGAKTASANPNLAAPIPPAEKLSIFQYVRAVRENFIAGYHRAV
jgi:hypothetical protein